MSLVALALALTTAPVPVGDPDISKAQSRSALGTAPELAVQPLAAGRLREAVAVLERASVFDPHDAGVLINLGIAYARAGEEEKARQAFNRALVCKEIVELDTADGSTTDSQKLARKAIRMLERGEFRAAAGRTEQLTYRN